MYLVTLTHQISRQYPRGIEGRFPCLPSKQHIEIYYATRLKSTMHVYRSSPFLRKYSIRYLSSMVNISYHDKFAIVKMNRPPVNSLNLELLEELSATVKELELNKNTKGFILASESPKVFSAGLDITEMLRPEHNRIRRFWSALQNVFLNLYSTNLITIAAIEGHSPAGGCLLSLCCDYRIMALGNSRIGLNETKLGLVAPFWFKDAMENSIGFRETEKMLQLGIQVDANRAVEINLVDEALEKQDVIKRATEKMVEYLSIPSIARIQTKKMMRQNLVDKLSSNLESDLQNFVTFAESPEVQEWLESYVEGLKRNKK